MAPLCDFVKRRATAAGRRGPSADSARGRTLSVLQAALSLLRNYSPMKAPAGFRLVDLLHN